MILLEEESGKYGDVMHSRIRPQKNQHYYKIAVTKKQ